MLVAPVAGALAERYGNRPFMMLGLGLQAAGYAWIAIIVSAPMSYTDLGIAFTIAGVGTSFCFPTVAGAVMGSVPLPEEQSPINAIGRSRSRWSGRRAQRRQKSARDRRS